ncbi:nuclear cap-binding protein subunit 3 [Tetranychus urticae]|uniref:Nuclear cap-binding protein subunit 3 n=1 Tax=Tetranychus urticae TaxID=32264 RepID=T1JSC4_TETUR|nr:nuclear cap-binding protein subunit 3 [Tetranychus urticae]
MDDTMEIETSAGDQIDDLVDYQSDNELQLETDPISDLQTQEIRIVLQEEAQSKQIVKLDDQKMSELYSSLGVPLEEINKKCSNWRLNVVHIRGVQEMNTNDVLELFNDYEPDFIEWVNDLSCNVLFADSRDAATALHGLSDALLLYKSQDNLEGIPDDVEVIDANSIDYPVPPNRWKLGKPHPKAKYLLLRFANNADKKMPGARKHSKFYEKYGVPDPKERSEKVKEAPRITISNDKLRRNISRTIENDEIVEVAIKSTNISPSLNMRMKADLERGFKDLSSRLKGNLRRRIGGDKRPRGSVWDRIQTTDSRTFNRNSRTVKVSNSGLRVFSRLGKPGRRER